MNIPPRNGCCIHCGNPSDYFLHSPAADCQGCQSPEEHHRFEAKEGDVLTRDREEAIGLAIASNLKALHDDLLVRGSILIWVRPDASIRAGDASFRPDEYGNFVVLFGTKKE